MILQVLINFSFRKIFIFICLAFFCVFISGKPVMAQDNDATLRVIATSEDDGLAVIGANIVLRSPEGDTLYAGVTNVDGFREFSNVTPGTYNILISYIGYETLNEEITLNPGQTRVYRPSLKTATIQIDEVVIGVERGAVRREAGKQTITPADIELIPAPGPGGDLGVYLQTLPGVVTTGDKGGEFFIRGGTPSQNRILLDNMPLVKPFHISNLFSAFPQEIISSADLYAGGFGAEYVGATSSVLDVSLRQGNLKRFESSVSASPYLLSFQAEGPLVKDKSSILFIGRRSVIDQTAPRLTGEEVPLKFGDALGRISVNWEGLTCNLTALRTYDRGKINPARDVRLEWTNTAAGVRCLGYGENLNNVLDFTMGYTGYNSSELGFGNIGRKSSVNRGFLRLDNEGELWGMPSDYGFSWNLNFYKATLDDPFPVLSGVTDRYADLESSIDILDSIFSAYVSVDWKPREDLTITPGLATQNRHRDMLITLEPRMRVVWNPGGSDKQEVTLAAGRYVQLMDGITDERDAGTVFYIYKPVASDESAPEALHGILGYRQTITENLEGNIEGYVKTQKNIPVSEWTREPGNTIRTAMAEGTTLGLDVQLEYNRYPFYVSLGYGWSEVTYEAPSDELVAWVDSEIFRYNPSHDLRHQLNIISSVQFWDFTANASWRYSSGAPYTKLYAFDFALPLQDLPNQNLNKDRGAAQSLYSTPFDGRLPSFHRLDVSLSRKINLLPGFSVEAEVGAINAYNVRNVFYFDVNTYQQVDQARLLPYASISADFNK